MNFSYKLSLLLQSSHEPKEFAPRSIAHGTELLDAWTPKTTATNTKVSQKPDVNKIQNNKKRSLSVSLFHLVLRVSK